MKNVEQAFEINVVKRTSVTIDQYPTDGNDLTFTVSNLLPDVKYTAYILGPRNYEVTLSSGSGEVTKSLSISEAGSYSIKVKSQMQNVKQESSEKSFTVTEKSSYTSNNSNDNREAVTTKEEETPKQETPKQETPKYTVRFKDYDGRLISEQRIEENGSATLPDTPSREGYIFVGWDKAYYDITSDTELKAQYFKENDSEENSSNKKTEKKEELKKWDSNQSKEEREEETGVAEPIVEVLTPRVNQKSKKKYSAKLTEEEIEDAMDNIMSSKNETDSNQATLNIDLSDVKKNFNRLTLSIPKESYRDMIEEELNSVELSIPGGRTLSIDLDALEEIYNQANGKNITMIVKKVNKKKLSKKTKESIGSSNVYTLDIKAGKTRIKSLTNGGLYTGNPLTQLSEKEYKKHLMWFK